MTRQTAESAFFGSYHKLGVWTAVSEFSATSDDPFYMYLISERLGLPTSIVSREFRRLELLGMIGLSDQPLHTIHGSAKQLQRLDDPLWGIVTLADRRFTQKFSNNS